MTFPHGAHALLRRLTDGRFYPPTALEVYDCNGEYLDEWWPDGFYCEPCAWMLVRYIGRHSRRHRLGLEAHLVQAYRDDLQSFCLTCRNPMPPQELTREGVEWELLEWIFRDRFDPSDYSLCLELRVLDTLSCGEHRPRYSDLPEQQWQAALAWLYHLLETWALWTVRQLPARDEVQWMVPVLTEQDLAYAEFLEMLQQRGERQ